MRSTPQAKVAKTKPISAEAAELALLRNDLKVSRADAHELNKRFIAATAQLDSTAQDLEASNAQRERIRVELERLRTEHARVSNDFLRIRAERDVLEQALALLARRVDLNVAKRVLA